MFFVDNIEEQPRQPAQEVQILEERKINWNKPGKFSVKKQLSNVLY